MAILLLGFPGPVVVSSQLQMSVVVMVTHAASQAVGFPIAGETTVLANLECLSLLRRFVDLELF